MPSCRRRTAICGPITKATGCCSTRCRRADYGTWRKRSLAEMEYAGQHEMLNWMALIGAMEALDRRPVIQDYMETYILASDKCFLSFPP